MMMGAAWTSDDIKAAYERGKADENEACAVAAMACGQEFCETADWAESVGAEAAAKRIRARLASSGEDQTSG